MPVTLTVPAGSPHIGARLGIRLWSYQGASGQTNFDLVTLQATDTGQSPIAFDPYPDPGSYDPADPPPWGWHYPIPAPVLRITSVVAGVCHLEWSPAGNYRLDYDLSPAFPGPLDSVEIDASTIQHDYDSGTAPARAFFRLILR